MGKSHRKNSARPVRGNPPDPRPPDCSGERQVVTSVRQSSKRHHRRRHRQAKEENKHSSDHRNSDGNSTARNGNQYPSKNGNPDRKTSPKNRRQHRQRQSYGDQKPDAKSSSKDDRRSHGHHKRSHQHSQGNAKTDSLKISENEEFIDRRVQWSGRHELPQLRGPNGASWSNYLGAKRQKGPIEVERMPKDVIAKLLPFLKTPSDIGRNPAVRSYDHSPLLWMPADPKTLERLVKEIPEFELTHSYEVHFHNGMLDLFQEGIDMIREWQDSLVSIMMLMSEMGQTPDCFDMISQIVHRQLLRSALHRWNVLGRAARFHDLVGEYSRKDPKSAVGALQRRMKRDRRCSDM